MSALIRLTLALACIGLAASRFGLVAHEFVGHGGAALLVGGEVTDVRLFWFAGGWIRYAVPAATVEKFVFIAMGGIAIELVLGGLVWLGAAWVIRRRGPTLGRRVVRGLGAAFAIHALWYLATGAWHGYGDGTLLYRVLGDARAPFAIAVGLAACGCAYLGARGVVGAIIAAMPGRGAARAGKLALAIGVAAGVNVGLDLGELRLRRDEIYAQTMQPERDRAIASDYARWVATHADVSIEDRTREQARLETVHARPFPFAIVLAIAVLGALVLGGRRSPRATEAPVPIGLVVRAIAAAMAGVALVIAIGAL